MCKTLTANAIGTDGAFTSDREINLKAENGGFLREVPADYATA